MLKKLQNASAGLALVAILLFAGHLSAFGEPSSPPWREIVHDMRGPLASVDPFVNPAACKITSGRMNAAGICMSYSGGNLKI